MEYTLVSEESVDALIAEVNRRIEHGWEPQGGVSSMAILLSSGKLSMRFFQAMIKR